MSDSLGYAVSPEEEASGEADKEERTEALMADFLTAFSGPSGERVLLYLSAYCYQTRSCYDRGDPYSTTFREGRRDVMLEIMRYLHMDDEALFRLSSRHSR